MKRLYMAAVIFAVSLCASAYDNLWVHLANRGLSDDGELLFVSNAIVRASKAGMKEVVWSGGLDTYWMWSGARKSRFEEAKRIAAENGIGIVPMIWSTGYATMCGVDAGLIESVQAKNMPYVAKGGKLVPERTTGNLVKNGGFETLGKAANVFAEWGAERPGVISFVDTATFHSGKSSIRMEPGPDKDKYGHARIWQRIALKPGRRYSISAWFKAKGLTKGTYALRMQIYLDNASENGGASAGKEISHLTDKEGWRRVSFEFASGEASGACIWCGTWGEKTGKFWVDDVEVEEVGIKDIAMRADSPRVMRNADTGRVYELGKDWLNPDWKAHKAGREIEFPIPAGSSIGDGEKVLLDTYIPSRSGPKLQMSTCMSDPHLYELFRKSAVALEEVLHPKKWFLSLDEVRNGGTCPLCSARRTDMAHILAGCVLRQHEIIRSVHPGAEIYVWSDMFDPFHNAKDQVCGCKGTFKGIWDLIPHDIIMVLWHHGVLDKTVPFFTERGFRVMGSISCDTNDLDRLGNRVGLYKRNLDAVPGSKGFMYTTWCRDFDKIEYFAKKINEK